MFQAQNTSSNSNTYGKPKKLSTQKSRSKIPISATRPSAIGLAGRDILNEPLAN